MRRLESLIVRLANACILLTIELDAHGVERILHGIQFIQVLAHILLGERHVGLVIMEGGLNLLELVD